MESLTSKEPTVLPADDRSARVEDVTTPVKSFASFTENAEWDRIAQQTHMSPYSPGRLGGKFPSKQQFSPSKTPGEERTPLKVQPSWLQRSPFGPASQTTVSTPSPRASDAGYKTALVEKHNKHVRDLKGYYEAEVQELKQQLEESRRLQANGERAKKSVSSQPASAELKMKCTHLQTQLQESQRCALLSKKPPNFTFLYHLGKLEDWKKLSKDRKNAWSVPMGTTVHTYMYNNYIL